MDLSVVLATYNRAESLKVTLETFTALECPSSLTWELLVVDNNSSDATPAIVKNFAERSCFPVRYVFEGQQGRSAALNAGISQAQGEIIVFTDDDVLLHREWLRALKQTFDRFDCEAVAGRVVPLWNHPKPEWLKMAGQFAVVNFDFGDDLREIKEPPLGANSAFRKGVFQRHGLFRLDLGVKGETHTVTCDDTEFGLRLIRAGEKIIYCPASIVFHPVDPKRTTKEYFLSWYYFNGVSVTRTVGLPNEGVFYFGVPRWLFRDLGSSLTGWFLTFDSNLRFQKKLQVYRNIGNIVESYRLSHLRSGSCEANDEASRGEALRGGVDRVGHA